MAKIDRERERRLFELAVRQSEEGLLSEAVASYQELLRLAPSRASLWFNLGLLAKRQRDWAECRRCNLRAAELDPSDQATWWNLGTAATALRDWETARRAWRRFGLRLPEGQGPVDFPAGPTPLRLNPATRGEVVWAERRDPVRAIIRNIPLPESGHRWGDVILHDGEPRGERTLNGRNYPVFDELERWEPSPIPTLRVEVWAATPADVAALSATFEEHDRAVEDWTASIRRICRACSEGLPHDHPAGAAVWDPIRDLGVAGELDRALPILEQWAKAAVNRELRIAEAIA